MGAQTWTLENQEGIVVVLVRVEGGLGQDQWGKERISRAGLFFIVITVRTHEQTINYEERGPE